MLWTYSYFEIACSCTLTSSSLCSVANEANAFREVDKQRQSQSVYSSYNEGNINAFEGGAFEMDYTTEQLAVKLKAISREAGTDATMHSCLRDFYYRSSLILNILTLLLSVVLLSVIWCQNGSIEFFGNIVKLQPIGGIAAILNFSLIVIDLVWRPSPKAQAYDQSARRFSKITHDIKLLLLLPEDLTVAKLKQVAEEYDDIRDVPAIPDCLILGLKRWHEQKLQLSHELERNPHMSIWFHKSRLFCRSCRKQTEDHPSVHAHACAITNIEKDSMGSNSRASHDMNYRNQ